MGESHVHTEMAYCANDVAAEMNFQIQEPVPEFVQMCLENDVRISFGTDSHNLTEVADFSPHLRFLQSLGVPQSEFAKIIWQPGG